MTNVSSITEEFEDFLKSNVYKVLLILSDSGGGKTQFCLKMTRELLERQGGYIPFFISLP